MLPHRCVHCLTPAAAELKFDRKGRPYTACKVCWAKSFYQSLDSLRGLAVVPQLVDNAMRVRAENPAYARQFDEKVNAVVQFVQNASRPPAMPMHEATAPAAFDEVTPAAKVGT